MLLKDHHSGDKFLCGPFLMFHIFTLSFGFVSTPMRSSICRGLTVNLIFVVARSTAANFSLVSDLQIEYLPAFPDWNLNVPEDRSRGCAFIR